MDDESFWEKYNEIETISSFKILNKEISLQWRLWIFEMKLTYNSNIIWNHLNKHRIWTKSMPIISHTCGWLGKEAFILSYLLASVKLYCHNCCFCRCSFVKFYLMVVLWLVGWWKTIYSKVCFLSTQLLWGINTISKCHITVKNNYYLCLS